MHCMLRLHGPAMQWNTAVQNLCGFAVTTDLLFCLDQHTNDLARIGGAMAEQCTSTQGWSSPAVCLQAAANTLDGMIDTVSAKHPLATYLATLKVGGVVIMVGVPDEPMELPQGNIIMRKLSWPVSQQLWTSQQCHTIVHIGSCCCAVGPQGLMWLRKAGPAAFDFVLGQSCTIWQLPNNVIESACHIALVTLLKLKSD